MNDQSKYIVPILVGIAAAFFANFDRVVPYVLTKITLRGEPKLEWVTVYRDVTEDLKGERIVTAGFDFSLDNDKIEGIENSPSNSNRTWRSSGQLYRDWVENKNQGPFVLINYQSISAKKIRASIGSIVLEPVTHSVPSNIQEYQGYWLGHEPDLDKIIVCPYILSSDPSDTAIKDRNSAWLNQDCAYRA